MIVKDIADDLERLPGLGRIVGKVRDWRQETAIPAERQLAAMRYSSGWCCRRVRAIEAPAFAPIRLLPPLHSPCLSAQATWPVQDSLPFQKGALQMLPRPLRRRAGLRTRDPRNLRRW